MKTCIRYLSVLPALIAALCLLTDGRVTAQTFTPLYSFSATSGNDLTNRDGAHPESSLLLSGNTLYGTTSAGGNSFGGGTVFKVNIDGKGFKTLHSFLGATHVPELILSGNTLYGIAEGGTIFKINTDGSGYKDLYTFTSYHSPYYTNSDGAHPYGGLIMSGNTLFGTACDGGTNGYGTIFSINTDGNDFTNLYNFTGGSDGANPKASLVLSGNTLYGTTYYGGIYDNASGLSFGTVFKINTDGTGFTNLYMFSGTGEGAWPAAALVLSGDTLYGTGGSVFKINTNGTGFLNLTDPSTLGLVEADAGLVLSSDTLYGASSGKLGNSGTVFAVNTNGTGITNIYEFSLTDGVDPVYTNSDGAYPAASLIISGNTLYGTARDGGTYGNGTIYSITLGATGGTGSLQVNLAPADAVSAGAQWQVDGNGWQTNGATVSGLSAGSHTVAFNSITGWTTPADQNVNLIADQTTTVTGTYTNVAANPVLQVRTIGSGTISPNYSNAVLVIGNSYKVTAKAAKGFKFSNWLVSTNWLGGTTSIKAALSFTMASDLTLQATFVDVTKPVLKIAKTLSKQTTNNIIVNGTASDNAQVAAVYYSLNGGGWLLATTANQFGNWSAALNLVPGANNLSVYAIDSSGNNSTTAKLKTTYTPPAAAAVAKVAGTVTANALAITDWAYAANGFSFTLQNSASQTGRIQVSTDLASWNTLTHFTGTNATIIFNDPAARDSSQRFYRAVSP